VLGAIALVVSRSGQGGKAQHNKTLNESMGYRNDLPTAGTTFDPHGAAPSTPPDDATGTDTADKDSNKNTTKQI
jgi:hypothetical protein